MRLGSTIHKLVPEYLARRRSEVDALVQHVAEADFAAIETIGHRMLGHGRSMGFARVSDIGRELEAAAGVRDTERINYALASYRQYLDSIDVEDSDRRQDRPSMDDDPQ